MSPRPGNDTSGDQTLQLTPEPISAPPRIGLFPSVGAKLLSYGIDIHGVAFDNFPANPTVGVQPGQTANLGAFRPVVDLDLQKLVGVPGGNIHFGMTFFGLRSDIPQIITQTGGQLTGFQTTPAVQTNIVSLFTYEQRRLDGRLSLEAGRTNAIRRGCRLCGGARNETWDRLPTSRCTTRSTPHSRPRSRSAWMPSRG